VTVTAVPTYFRILTFSIVHRATRHFVLVVLLVALIAHRLIEESRSRSCCCHFITPFVFMSNKEKDNLYWRSQDELEGALLLPKAYVVALSHEDEPYATAMVEDASVGIQVDHASAPVVVSSKKSDLEYTLIEHSEAEQGTAIGRSYTDMERSDILRENLRINALSYHAKEAVKEANERAKLIKAKESLGLLQTSDFVRPAEVPPSRFTPPVETQGTFGKDYEVSPYETTPYETSEYETTDYKSVYES
jgi:hypothetical protein